MIKVDKDYTFDGPNGTTKLADMFEGRKQLIIYHFMLAPEDEAGCSGCSFMADNLPRTLAHLHFRDTSLALVSRAPLAKIEKYKKRMDWVMPWYSSFGTDFNYDFHVTMDESIAPVQYNVSFLINFSVELKLGGVFFGLKGGILGFDKCSIMHKSLTFYQYKDKEAMSKGKNNILKGEGPGLSVFFKDGEQIYHTYSTYARGLDQFLVVHKLLDITPLGRPDGMAWKRHDEY